MNAYVEKLLKGDSIAGIELVIQDTGYLLHVTHVKRKKNKAVIQSSHTVTEIESLTKIINKQPVVLSVSGKGIIHRKTGINVNDNETTILAKVLPNASPGDFYLQQTPIDENSVFVSVIRKSQLDALLDEFQKNAIEVIDCNLGPFNINSIASSLPLHNFNIGEVNLSVTEDRIHDLKKADEAPLEDFKIGDEVIKNEYLLSFATAITYFTASTSSASIKRVANSSSEYRQKRIFTIGGYALLLFFFIALQANSLLFSHFKDKRDNLESKVTLNKSDVERYTKLKIEYEEKRSFFERSGLLDNMYPSYCADQVAMYVPATIRLTEMNINPALKKQVNLEDELSFTTKRISVSGLASKSTDLNEWIKVLNKMSWISQVTLLNYSQDKQKKEAEFNLDIQTK